MDLLTAMWPESIDRLDPDPGWRKGPKPKIVRRSGFQELFRFISKDRIDVKYITSQFPEPYPLTPPPPYFRSEFSSGQCERF